MKKNKENNEGCNIDRTPEINGNASDVKHDNEYTSIVDWYIDYKQDAVRIINEYFSSSGTIEALIGNVAFWLNNVHEANKQRNSILTENEACDDTVCNNERNLYQHLVQNESNTMSGEELLENICSWVEDELEAYLGDEIVAFTGATIASNKEDNIVFLFRVDENLCELVTCDIPSMLYKIVMSMPLSDILIETDNIINV